MSSPKKPIERVLAELRVRPKDAELLLRAAELYQESGNSSEAARYLVRVAQAFADGGFYLKAVSLLKQVLKLDPSFVLAREALADLYTQLGLHAEAISEHLRLLETFRFFGSTDATMRTLEALARLGFRPGVGQAV